MKNRVLWDDVRPGVEGSGTRVRFVGQLSGCPPERWILVPYGTRACGQRGVTNAAG